MNHSFKDPENREEIIRNFISIINTDDKTIQDYINNIFPNWLILSLDRYSADYPHLHSNWNKICQMNRVEPQKIVLVADIIFDDEHKILRTFCEAMTRKGYVVRRSGEFIACSNCLAAIPCEEIYVMLKQKNFTVPETWLNRCSNC